MQKFKFLICLFLISSTAIAGDGLVKTKSMHSVEETINRLEKIVLSKGMKVFSRIDHAKGARNVGMPLRPTELIIFGNPKLGSKLIECAQSVSIDLPLKALASQDEQGQVWLTYNAPDYLAERHEIQGCKTELAKMAKALGNFASMATSPDKAQNGKNTP